MVTQMTDTESVARHLDRHPRGLQIEVRDLWNGARYGWNGAHTVNIYDFDGNNVDVYSFGDFAEDHATLAEFLQSVMDHVDSDS